MRKLLSLFGILGSAGIIVFIVTFAMKYEKCVYYGSYDLVEASATSSIELVTGHGPQLPMTVEERMRWNNFYLLGWRDSAALRQAGSDISLFCRGSLQGVKKQLEVRGDLSRCAQAALFFWAVKEERPGKVSFVVGTKASDVATQRELFDKVCLVRADDEVVWGEPQNFIEVVAVSLDRGGGTIIAPNYRFVPKGVTIQ